MTYDERIFQGDYCVLEHQPDATKRLWVFREEKYLLPAGAVKEYWHKSLRVTFANRSDVMAMREAA